MKNVTLLACAMLMFVGSASAAGFLESVDDRADALQTQLKGNNSYQAHLAREFADIALEEKDQHDIDVASNFMGKAEAVAAQAGGSK